MAMAMVSSAGDASVIQKYRDAAIADIGVFADLPTQNVEDWIDRVNNVTGDGAISNYGFDSRRSLTSD